MKTKLEVTVEFDEADFEEQTGSEVVDDVIDSIENLETEMGIDIQVRKVG